MPHQDPHLVNQMFGAPINGQSLTHAPKSMPYEKPPTFTKLSEAMHFVMDQLLEPHKMKDVLGMMDAGMPIEALARTILFTGFTLGRWTPDLGMLMYKPIMLALIALAHRAGIKDVPIVLPDSLDKYIKTNTNKAAMIAQMRGDKIPIPKEFSPVVNNPVVDKKLNGFMSRGNS